jgi:hypothetical protein
MKKPSLLIIAGLLCMSLTITLTPAEVSANVTYMPDVTKEMSKAAYWSDKLYNPGEVLASQSELEEINAAITQTQGIHMADLANYSKTSFNGVQAAERLKNSASSDLDYFYSAGVRYDDKGNTIGRNDGYFSAMTENCADPSATEEMPIQYAVCTTRTVIHATPSDKPLHDDPADPDFDYQNVAMVRVNEPMILDAKSADGRYYCATTSNVSGWISVEDIAICADREEWLDAWSFPAEKTLVVYDDKIYTEDSNFAPQTANRKLPMGTCLKLADPSDWSGRINNRTAYNNYVVWMPVRSEDGTYRKELALIGESKKVSEGFLPLTSENISMVAMNQLGDTYGWGGMLGSNDCSGYVRDVYKCFGLEIARNTSWQAQMPTKNIVLSGMSDREKTDTIKELPLGTILIFNGHEMLYLGNEGDKLYVISSISSAVVNGAYTRVRGGVINTLDITRGSGRTWLQELTNAVIPYYDPEHAVPKRTIDPPAAPVISTSGSYAKKTVKVSWKKVSGATGYKAEYKKAGGSWTAKSTTGLKINMTGLKNKGAYQFRTAALKKKGTKTAAGKYSNISYRYMSAVKTGLKGKRKAVKVTWKKDPSASGYTIKYSTGKSMKNAKSINVKGASKKAYTIKKLKKGKRYYVKVRPYKKTGGKTYTGIYSGLKSVKAK